ncbi:MAG TPA: hypothetical protein VK272_04490 [Solirubrobacteraceae bacterium]|nr:hypothetical protein [Solirubrobacteraceae bacterium]
MQRLRIFGLALAAVFALGTLASAAAQAAAPEFVPVVSGKLEGTIGSTDFAVLGYGNFEYASGKISAEVASHKALKNVKLTFTEGPIKGCNTGSLELVMSELGGRLGYLNKEHNEVGVMFEKKDPVVECEQTGSKLAYVGVFTARITPIATKTKKFTLKLESTIGPFFEGEKENGLIFPLTLGTGKISCKVFLGKEYCEHPGDTTQIKSEMKLESPQEMEIT